MEEIAELRQKIETLTKLNQEYSSAKQSLFRMSTRLRKLCKRLTPTDEIVLEMQKISAEIRDFARIATQDADKR